MGIEIARSCCSEKPRTIPRAMRDNEGQRVEGHQNGHNGRKRVAGLGQNFERANPYAGIICFALLTIRNLLVSQEK